MSIRTHAWRCAAALAALPALAQEQRPDEGALFGGETPEAQPAPADAPRPDESALFGEPPSRPERPRPRPAARPRSAAEHRVRAGPGRAGRLGGPAATNAFDTEEAARIR